MLKNIETLIPQLMQVHSRIGTRITQVSEVCPTIDNHLAELEVDLPELQRNLIWVREDYREGWEAIDVMVEKNARKRIELVRFLDRIHKSWIEDCRELTEQINDHYAEIDNMYLNIKNVFDLYEERTRYGQQDGTTAGKHSRI